MLSKAVYVSEQVCIGWCRTGAYYTAKLTFSYDFPIQLWGAYYTSVRIIEFIRYQCGNACTELLTHWSNFLLKSRNDTNNYFAKNRIGTNHITSDVPVM